MRHRNFLLRTDSYKVTHWKQYPPQTEEVYSYLESRGGMFQETVFFGLQYYLKEYLQGCVFRPLDIRDAEEKCDEHFGQKGLFNRAGWEYILNQHGGTLPLEIKAVPEGTVVPTSNVLMTVRNTDPKCFWLTNWIETMLLKVWYPITVATLSREIKKTILSYLEKTGDPNGVNFKLHDFGYRGVSSEESADIGAAAHLVNFLGTDTLAGIEMLEDYYRCDMPGYSIPASEHSTMTSWGKEHEVDAYRNMLDSYPSGPVACVSDSYDIYNACEKLWGEALREKVLGRTGFLVVRPDSGDPIEVVPKVMGILGEKLGFTVNSKGYKVLSPQVRVIQGDGVNYQSIHAILAAITSKGWSADNLAFGMGGALLQQLNRDTQKFAFKCSNIKIAGVDHDVWKDPVTDPGKWSKRGRLALVERSNGELGTMQVHDDSLSNEDLLETVFLNGEVKKEYRLEEIRNRAAVSLTADAAASTR